MKGHDPSGGCTNGVISQAKLDERYPAVGAARERARGIRQRILRWWRKAARHYPWRENGRTAYEILVAEMLLKRTTASAAARLYQDFLRQFPSVEALDKAPEHQVEEALATVGLQRQRARGFKGMARYLSQVTGGEVPNDLGALCRVPQVGKYASAAVASFAMGIPVAVLDSNVERILRRVFMHTLPAPPGPSLLRILADMLLPPRAHREFNLAMLDLGAGVCRYVRPRCAVCPIRTLCDYGATEVRRP